MSLDPDLLLKAYAIGVFPMADTREDPEIFWVEPQMRAILPLDGFHLSRSLAKTLRRGRFRITCNAAFARVIAACAETAGGRDETWINAEIERAYTRLHHTGHAHSIECWQAGDLVGGLYGVSLGRAFCGESMFSRTSDASKAALAALVAAMRYGGYTLLDCQFMTDHLARMGAREIAQKDYLRLLTRALYGVDVARDCRDTAARDQPPGALGAGADGGALGAGALGAGTVPGALEAGALAADLGTGPATPTELPLPAAFAGVTGDGAGPALGTGATSSALASPAAGADDVDDASVSKDGCFAGAPSSPGNRIAQFLTQTS